MLLKIWDALYASLVGPYTAIQFGRQTDMQYQKSVNVNIFLLSNFTSSKIYLKEIKLSIIWMYSDINPNITYICLNI